MKREIQVGDLVKFCHHMHMPGCLGIVVALNGEAFDVQWIDENSLKCPSGRGGAEISAELPEFLEVVSEAR